MARDRRRDRPRDSPRDRLRDGTTTLTITAPPGAEAGPRPDTGADPGPDPIPIPIPSTVVPLEIAASYRARTRGLIGRDGFEGALLLTPANSVHTFRMRFPIDVAHLDRDFWVIAVRTLRPGRIGALRLRARHVLEAEAGAMERWGLRPGARVEIG